MFTNSEPFFGNIEWLQLKNAMKCNYEVGQGKDIISEKWNLNLICQQNSFLVFIEDNYGLKIIK